MHGLRPIVLNTLALVEKPFASKMGQSFKRIAFDLLLTFFITPYLFDHDKLGIQSKFGLSF